jgi:hypothetical protein
MADRVFEEGFAAVERACASLRELLAAAGRQERALAKAAHEGDLAKLHKATEALGELGLTVAESVHAATSAWPLSATEEEQYLDDPGGYEQELTSVALKAGVRLDRLDDRLSAFPVLVKIQAAQRQLRLDAKRIAALRPSVVAERLRTAQRAKARLSPERFIETLFAAYRHVVPADAIGRSIRLTDIYDALTIHPEMRKSYDKAEFTRDVHGLDRSAINRTKQGFVMSLPSATAERSRAGVLSIVGADGRIFNYSGIRFERTDA